MQISEFYALDTPISRSSVYAPPTNLQKGSFRNLVRGIYAGIDLPVVFKIKWGRKINDLIDTTAPPLYLISEKLKTTLKDNHLTGWETFPVIFLDQNDNEIHGYHGFAVTGKCGFINSESARIIESILPKSGRIVQNYQGITADNWEGTDFFSPKGRSRIFITTKAANAIKNSNTTNVILTKSNEYIYDSSRYEEYLEDRVAFKTES